MPEFSGDAREAKEPPVVKTEHGYYRLAHVPSPEALRAFYAAEYFQKQHGNYRRRYSEAEATYRQHKLEQKAMVIEEVRGGVQGGRLLDYGCGEGWALSYFDRLGWDVFGLDHDDFAVRAHNNHVAPHVVIGEPQLELERLAERGGRFDVVWLTNVLEHVPDPERTLALCAEVSALDGVVVAEVPNDFSPLQLRALELDMIDRPFWIAVPDHINYFSADSLSRAALASGWRARRILSDFPVDWLLFNDRANYVRDPSAGPAAHNTRVEIENMLHAASPTDTVHMYECLARLRMGRQLTAFFQQTAGRTYRALGDFSRAESAEYALVPIRYSDLASIKRWRNDQAHVLRNPAPLADADQERYYDREIAPAYVAAEPANILFSMLRNAELIAYGGLTHIDWSSGTAELSFLADSARASSAETYEADFSAFLRLLLRVSFHHLRMTRVFAETYDIRSLHISLLERNGFALEGRMKHHVTIDGVATDSLIHAVVQSEHVER